MGSEVVRQLSSIGQKVRAAVHSTTPASSDNKLTEIELVEADYTRPETVLAAFKNQSFSLQ